MRRIALFLAALVFAVAPAPVLAGGGNGPDPCLSNITNDHTWAEYLLGPSGVPYGGGNPVNGIEGVVIFQHHLQPCTGVGTHQFSSVFPAVLASSDGSKLIQTGIARFFGESQDHFVWTNNDQSPGDLTELDTDYCVQRNLGTYPQLLDRYSFKIEYVYTDPTHPHWLYTIKDITTNQSCQFQHYANWHYTTNSYGLQWFFEKENSGSVLGNNYGVTPYNIMYYLQGRTTSQSAFEDITPNGCFPGGVDASNITCYKISENWTNDGFYDINY